jgi:hypothetical protein
MHSAICTINISNKIILRYGPCWICFNFLSPSQTPGLNIVPFYCPRPIKKQDTSPGEAEGTLLHTGLRSTEPKEAQESKKAAFQERREFRRLTLMSRAGLHYIWKRGAPSKRSVACIYLCLDRLPDNLRTPCVWLWTTAPGTTASFTIESPMTIADGDIITYDQYLV